MEAHAAMPDGRQQPLIRIDDWDFKWQDVYRYAQPLRLPKGTVVSFRYTYRQLRRKSAESESPSNASRRGHAVLKRNGPTPAAGSARPP